MKKRSGGWEIAVIRKEGDKKGRAKNGRRRDIRDNIRDVSDEMAKMEDGKSEK